MTRICLAVLVFCGLFVLLAGCGAGRGGGLEIDPETGVIINR